MLNNEAIDDVPVPDVTPNFLGGLASAPPPATLAENQFAIGINTMIGRTGALQTRRGTAYLGDGGDTAHSVFGLSWFETSTNRCLFAVWSDGACRFFDGVTWAPAAGYTAAAATPIAIVQGAGKLYMSNGTDNPRSWDGAAFVDLGSGATDAPKAKLLEWGASRLIAAGVTAAPDTLYFSDILDPTSGHWSAANTMRVGGDGQPITGIKMWSKTVLAVFKRSKIYLVDINPTVSVSQYVVEEVAANVGCSAPKTITRVGRDLWFLAQDGVRALSRVLQGEDTDVTSPITLPVADQTRLINLDSVAVQLTCAAFYQGRFFLSHWNALLGVGEGTTGMYVLVYNVSRGVWEGRWTGLEIYVMAVAPFLAAEWLALGTNGKGVIRWRAESNAAEVAADFQDAGAVEIATQIRTRAKVFGADQNKKQGFAIEPEFDTSTATAAAIKVVPDEGAPVTLTSVTPSGKVPLTMLHQPPFRSLGVDISTTSGKLAVRAVRATAFMETMPVGQ